MAMAQVMSGMPDVWRKVLAEHVADQRGRCQACRDEGGRSASWPCLTRRIAEQAKRIHDNPELETPALPPTGHLPEPVPLHPTGPVPTRSTGHFPEPAVPHSTGPVPLYPGGAIPLHAPEPPALRTGEWAAKPVPLRSTGRHAAP